MTSSSCESMDHMASIRSSPRALAAGDGASWEEGSPSNIPFTKAAKAAGVRGCLGGQRESVEERRVWYVATSASTALESAGVECSCTRYLRLMRNGSNASNETCISKTRKKDVV